MMKVGDEILFSVIFWYVMLSRNYVVGNQFFFSTNQVFVDTWDLMVIARLMAKPMEGYLFQHGGFSSRFESL